MGKRYSKEDYLITSSDVRSTKTPHVYRGVLGQGSFSFEERRLDEEEVRSVVDDPDNITAPEIVGEVKEDENDDRPMSADEMSSDPRRVRELEERYGEKEEEEDSEDDEDDSDDDDGKEEDEESEEEGDDESEDTEDSGDTEGEDSDEESSEETDSSEEEESEDSPKEEAMESYKHVNALLHDLLYQKEYSAEQLEEGKILLRKIRYKHQRYLPSNVSIEAYDPRLTTRGTLIEDGFKLREALNTMIKRWK